MQNNCWRDIGVWGDRTCPKLADEIHCHNCSVYSQVGRALLDRVEPAGYTAEWTDLISLPRDSSHGQSRQERLSMMVFRLGQEWLGLPADIFHQVSTPAPVHSLPHQREALLRGIVNVHGQLLPCVSLHELLNIAGSMPAAISFADWTSASAAASTAALGAIALSESRQQGGYPRLVVLKRLRETWAFEVDEFYGLHLCQRADVREMPVASNQVLTRFTESMLTWRDQNVSYLDAEQLFLVLRQRAI